MRAAAVTVVALTLALLAACGGGNDSGSPTPSATSGASSSASATPAPTSNANAPGQQTVNAAACTRDDLHGRFVSEEGAAGHVYLTLQVDNPARACTLPGPPELRWYDAAGKGLTVPYTPVDDCTSGETDFSACIYSGPVNLAPGGKTAAVRAIAGVANIGVLQPCGSPALEAHTVGLQFPDTPLDIQITLPDDIALQSCVAQVTMEGYGPYTGNP